MADTAESSTLSYEGMTFQEREEYIRVFFQRYFYFDIPRKDLDVLKLRSVERDALAFGIPEKKAHNKVQLLLEQGFQRLKNNLTDRHATYIHHGLGIPLMGNNAFGVVDRGSNIIEIKPVTGCNLKCVFCSVKEGRDPETMGWEDYVVERSYLVQETAKIAAIKKHPVEINIGPQGEPLLYPEMVELVRDLKGIPNVSVISVNTNGVLLNPALIDKLAEAGLTRINLSLHALKQDLAQELMGAQYSLKHILDVIEYAKTKLAVLIAPVLVPGMNEGEMKGLVELSQRVKQESTAKSQSRFPTIGIQNFLNYKHGRNVAKAKPWEEFFADLQKLEKDTGANLLLKQGKPGADGNPNPFSIHPEETLPKPFVKDEIIEAVVKCPGRYPGEMIAVARGRNITIIAGGDSKDGKSSRDRGDGGNTSKIGSTVHLRIVRDKHNIFQGILTKAKATKFGRDARKEYFLLQKHKKRRQQRESSERQEEGTRKEAQQEKGKILDDDAP